MSKKQYKYLVFILLLFSGGQLLFNGYYFFIRREVGPNYYIEKILNNPKDRVVDYDIHKDMAEEYFHLNQLLKNRSFTVFAGDSITKRFNIAEFTADRDILNRGIFFDTTHGFLTRLDKNINNLEINKLFLMIGYNDLKYRSNDEIFDNIKKIVSRIKAKKIYIQSLLPVGSNRTGANERIMRINKWLKKLARDEGHIYIDLHSRFMDGRGGVKPELARDGVHPGYPGYKLWFSIIEPYL